MDILYLIFYHRNIAYIIIYYKMHLVVNVFDSRYNITKAVDYIKIYCF